MATYLRSLVDEEVCVITGDGRTAICGRLKGCDRATNVILSDAHERIYSKSKGVVKNELGLYIIRGDNISVVGRIDKELENQMNYNTLNGEKIKPIKHWQPS